MQIHDISLSMLEQYTVTGSWPLSGEVLSWQIRE